MPRLIAGARARPELLGVLVVAALLNLWGLQTNGWANTFYSAAVRSMTTSWHDFLFASLDKAGLMTVDKPPLALWVQALSARVFGLNSLSILVPQALMGVAAAGLTYDLVRRRFGRAAGAAAGLALALTPMTVAISRHNNPDQLLILCSVAALWFAARALEDGAHQVAGVVRRVRRARLSRRRCRVALFVGARHRARLPLGGSAGAGWPPSASSAWAGSRWRSSASPGRCWSPSPRRPTGRGSPGPATTASGR